MCGILGYSSRAGMPDLASGLREIAHRGPDGEGIWSDETAGMALGHTRLAIIDLTDCGRQPMTSASGRHTISYNGELYNFRELRADLEATGTQFQGHSDTEVLLELLDRDGLACLPRLNGIFAFALADHAAGTITLVRDRMGVKPLYLADEEGCVRFASEVKALVAMGAAPGEVDPEALARYLTFLWNPGDTMPTTGFRKLGPGRAVTLDRGDIVRQWEWQAPPILDPRKSTASQASLVDELRVRLKTAVERQLVADVPVGTFLSGGLDSSLITALARERIGSLPCFTIDSPGLVEEGVTDDLPYARRVADHLGVELNVISVTPARSIEAIKSMVYDLDEPLADPAAVSVKFITALARANDIKVLLSGAGGDDLFTGYRRHAASRYHHVWTRAPAPVRRALAGFARNLNRRAPLKRRIAKLLDNVDLDGNAALVNYFYWAGRDDVVRLFRPRFRQEIERADFARPMLAHLERMGDDADDIDRLLALEQRFFLSEHNLTYTDKMSMANGVEVRVPFLDNELVDFAATIPTRFLQKGAEGKWILKKAAEPLLPRDVIYRPKTGFGVPLRHWIRHDLREFVTDNLSSDRIRDRGIFDPAAVQELVQRNHNGGIDASYTVLSLLCIELWFQTFVDGNGPPSPHTVICGLEGPESPELVTPE